MRDAVTSFHVPKGALDSGVPDDKVSTFRETGRTRWTYVWTAAWR